MAVSVFLRLIGLWGDSAILDFRLRRDLADGTTGETGVRDLEIRRLFVLRLRVASSSDELSEFELEEERWRRRRYVVKTLSM